MEDKPKIPKPEFNPQRKPEALSRNFQKRMEQLDVIASNPSDSQISKMADALKAEDPSLGAEAEEQARAAYANFSEVSRQRADASQELKQLRRAALTAPRDQFAARMAEYKEAEKRLNEINGQARMLSAQFRDAGIQLEPDQLGQNLDQKVQKAAFGVGWQLAAGEQRVREVATQGKQAIESVPPAVMEQGRKLASAGRESFGAGFRASSEFVSSIYRNGQQKFDSLKTSVQTKAGGLAENIGDTWHDIQSKAEELRENITQPLKERASASSNWIKSTTEEMGDKLKADLNTQIQTYKNLMTKVGETARATWDPVSENIKAFTTEQADRVNQLQSAIRNRINTEVQTTLDKAKLFISPALESINRDRERLKDEATVQVQKLGILTSHVGTLAAPIIDRILDEGRDARDGVVGLSQKGIEGARVFGRQIKSTASEKAPIAWEFLSDRFESLTVRANESRDRLNLFLTDKLGDLTLRLSPLSESLQAQKDRAQAVFSGVVETGGKVMLKGQELTGEARERFLKTGVLAQEFIKQNAENASKGLSSLKNYWEVYALNKWREASLPDVDIKRRLKVLRALGPAASLTAAAGVEAANFALRDPRGRLLVGAAALTYMLIANPEISSNIQHFVGNLQLPGGVEALTPPPLDSIPQFPTPDATPASPSFTPEPLPHHGQLIPPDATPPHVEPDMSGAVPLDRLDIPTPHPESLGGEQLSTTPTSEQLTPDVQLSPETSAETVTSATLSPEVNSNLETVFNQIKIGEPIDTQLKKLAESLPGNASDNYYSLLKEAFAKYQDNFQTTAQAIIDSSSSFSPEQVQQAKDQLEAITKLRQDTSLTGDSNEGYSSFMKAMHYWRPI